MTDTPNTPETGSGEAPLILGKYKTQADLEKAYVELQSKFTQSRQASTQGEGPDLGIPTGRSGEPLKMDAFQDYFTEYAENGALSEESLGTLQSKFGLAPELVTRFIENETLAANFQKTQLLTEIGGEDAYNKAVEWAAEHLSEDAIKEFNEDLDSGDLRLAKRAMKNLVSDYERANGGPIKLLQGTGQASGLKPFTSMLEYGRAIKAAKSAEEHALIDARFRVSNLG